MPPKSSAQARGRSQHSRNASVASHPANNETEEPFFPAADAATFRDLLIFEERLKQNAARLQARKRKYEVLLFGFVVFILCLAHLVVISPRSSVFVQYSLAAVLMICLTTLFLFFASGMHAERIRSANKFVPQANRSLRSFNMYLNTRTASSTRWWSIGRLLRSHDPPHKSKSSASSEANTLNGSVDRALKSSKSSGRASNGSSGSFHSTSSGSSTPRKALSSIPPSRNNRGELIFSNRVSAEFREGYERYRAAFERRRAEKMAAKRAQSWKRCLDLVLGRRPVQPAPRVSASSRQTAAAASWRSADRSGQRSSRTANAIARPPPSPRPPSEGGLSDDGYPPSFASGSSLSGHEPL